ncbi:hypothetical protein IFR05_011960 [Cadophora sp. M221]|nr:hypothetical protein IFR05_011960 [Cadophora sp. M221]
MLKQILLAAAVAVSVAASESCAAAASSPEPLRVETHVNGGLSFDTVSSLIIGAEAAVLIDMPLAIPQARDLAAWVKNTTDKPLVGVFCSHFHPDHYLSGGALLDQFPGTPFYASIEAIEHIQFEVSDVAKVWAGVFGQENIVAAPTVPEPYNFSIITLPGNQDSPIHLINPLVGDTIDETLFWIPSIKTLIAGDSIFASNFHCWLTDLLTPTLTKGWLSTLDLIEDLAPEVIIPGHSVVNSGFGPSRDLEYTRKYVTFFQTEIEAKGVDFFTVPEIVNKFDVAFPGLSQNNVSTTPAVILNFTANEFGRGGNRFKHHVDLKSFQNATGLSGYELGQM